MNVQIELWQLITLLIGFLGACGATAKLLLDQMKTHLDERFVTQQKSISAQHTHVQHRLEAIELASREEAKEWHRIERDLLQLMAELPVRFVMRDDYVRGQSIIEAKLDGLAVRIENVQLRGAATATKGA